MDTTELASLCQSGYLDLFTLLVLIGLWLYVKMKSLWSCTDHWDFLRCDDRSLKFNLGFPRVPFVDASWLLTTLNGDAWAPP